ncbi:MAG TPA: hypothetical protein ENK18_12910 [Deltaproteobacteria bacterium]|nr:hypothetical protein [Deltaproteobacteria bacterium]
MDDELTQQMDEYRNNDLIPWLQGRGYAQSGRALGRVMFSRGEREITVPLWFDPVREQETEDFNAQMASCLREVASLEGVELDQLIEEIRLKRLG